jgi:hypothetical protein
VFDDVHCAAVLAPTKLWPAPAQAPLTGTSAAGAAQASEVVDPAGIVVQLVATLLSAAVQVTVTARGTPVHAATVGVCPAIK